MSKLLFNDLAFLLQGISAESPCGEDLRYDPAYDHIRELMRSEVNDLPVGIWERDLKRPDWDATGRFCEEILKTRSKDLQIAAWLCESLVQRSGLQGLVAGWEVFAGLLTTFWQEIHPRLEQTNAELRLTPIHWMNRHSAIWLKGCSSDDAVASRELLQSLAEHISRVDAFIFECLGDQAPAFGSLIEEVKRRLAVIKPMAAVEAIAKENKPEGNVAAVIPAKFDEQVVTSRDEAYAAIGRIGLYLSKTEPHSPVPDILLAISNWRDLGFGDLVELMPEGKNSLYELINFFRKR